MTIPKEVKSVISNLQKAGFEAYAVGGWVDGSNLIKNEEYDPAANAWTALTPAPTGGYNPGIAVVGNLLYESGVCVSGG